MRSLNALLILSVALWLFPSCTSKPEKVVAEKPHILFIPVDDLKPMLGCYGDSIIKTPNIDRLAASGVVFLNNSCQMAVCGPSRASLLTGMYPDYTKVWDLKTKMRDIHPDILSLPQYFRQQGYTTAGVGKTFDSRCVDGPEFLDKPSWSIPYLKIKTAQYANPEVIAATREATKKVEGQTFEMGYLRSKEIARIGGPLCRPSTECMDVPDDTYPDGVNARAGLELLEQLAGEEKPFFLSVGFAKPHLPFVAPKKYWDLYDDDDIKIAEFQGRSENGPEIAYKGLGEMEQYGDIPRVEPINRDLQKRLVHGYMAATSYVDAQIGLLLDKLEELGIAENTIICLWGDHGFHLGDHGLWTKHTNFEQAVRSPLIISAPGDYLRHKTEAPTEFVDIFPTLCELSGLSIPDHLQGTSLVPILNDSTASVRYAAMGQYNRNVVGIGPAMGYTLRSERYRYVKWLLMNYLEGETRGELVATELYDYQNDPHETVNLAHIPEYQELVASFEADFTRRNIAQTNDPVQN